MRLRDLTTLIHDWREKLPFKFENLLVHKSVLD